MVDFIASPFEQPKPAVSSSIFSGASPTPVVFGERQSNQLFGSVASITNQETSIQSLQQADFDRANQASRDKQAWDELEVKAKAERDEQARRAREEKEIAERTQNLVKSTGLSQFISSLNKHGLVRNSKYLMVFNHPVKTSDRLLGLPEISNIIKKVENELLKFYCHSVKMPSYDISTTPVRTQGNTYEIPYSFSRGSNTFSVSFYMDRSFFVHTYFASWVDEIVDRDNFQMGYYGDYTTDMELIFIDHDVTAASKKRIEKELNKTWGESLVNQVVDNFKSSAIGAVKSKVKSKLGNSFGGKIFNKIMGDAPESKTKDIAVEDVPVVVTKFISAYPKRISAIDMNAEGSSFVDVEIEFAFERIETSYPGQSRDWVTGFKTKKPDNSLFGKIKSAAMGIVGSKVINTADKIGGKVINKTINKL